MLFHVGFMSVMLWASTCIVRKTAEHHKICCMAWTEQNTLFHVGLGFRVGFVGAQSSNTV